MNRRNFKVTLSIVLTLAMILSVLPVTAFAETNQRALASAVVAGLTADDVASQSGLTNADRRYALAFLDFVLTATGHLFAQANNPNNYVVNLRAHTSFSTHLNLLLTMYEQNPAANFSALNRIMRTMRDDNEVMLTMIRAAEPTGGWVDIATARRGEAQQELVNSHLPNAIEIFTNVTISFGGPTGGANALEDMRNFYSRNLTHTVADIVGRWIIDADATLLNIERPIGQAEVEYIRNLFDGLGMSFTFYEDGTWESYQANQGTQAAAYVERGTWTIVNGQLSVLHSSGISLDHIGMLRNSLYLGGTNHLRDVNIRLIFTRISNQP